MMSRIYAPFYRRRKLGVEKAEYAIPVRYTGAIIVCYESQGRITGNLAMQLTITDTALERLLAAMQAQDMALEDYAIRIRIIGRMPERFKYDFRSVPRSERRTDDIVLEIGGFPVYIDSLSVPKLDGSVIDIRTPEGGFKIDNPNPVFTSPLEQQVAEVIEQQINPGVSLHGGQIVLVDVIDSVAYITMEGGCKGCSLALATMKDGIEKMLREAIPAIREVVDITAHQEGTNPYFSSPDGAQSPFGR
jgi:Fe/S biogenesis protein NfuA